MKKLMGSPGTKTGLILRLGQCGFATASIAVMVSTANFYSISAFWILVLVLGLQVLWSFGLACVDVHALRVKRDLQSPSLVFLLTGGYWVTLRKAGPMLPWYTMAMGGSHPASNIVNSQTMKVVAITTPV